MKTKLTLLLGLFTALLSAAVFEIPFTAERPNMNGINPGEWTNWPQIETLNRTLNTINPASVCVNARIAYDNDNLYVGIQVPKTGHIEAGFGSGVPWQNDGMDFRFTDAYGREWLIYVDAAGRTMTMLNRHFCTGGGYTAKARVLKDIGFDVFLEMPWKKLGRPAPRPGETVTFQMQFRRNFYPAASFPYGLGENGEEKWELKCTGKKVALGKNADPDADKVVNVNNEDRVVNFGRGGFNSYEVNDMLTSILDYKPTLATVMVGTNDVVYKIKVMTPDAYKAQICAIMDKLQAANCKLIWITMPPCCDDIVIKREGNDYFGGMPPNVKIALLNAIAVQVANERGIPVVDFWQMVARRGDLGGKTSLLRNNENVKAPDGVHPTAEGYQLMAEAVMECIRKHNLPTERVACIGDSITYGSAMEGAGYTIGECYPAFLRTLLLKSNPTKQ